MSCFVKSPNKQRRLCLLALGLLLSYGCYYSISTVYRAMFNQCNGGILIEKLCNLYSLDVIGGPACTSICTNRRWFFACPVSNYEASSYQTSLQKDVDVTYAIKRSHFDSIILGISPNQLHQALRPESYGNEFQDIVGFYLNSGRHSDLWSALIESTSPSERMHLKLLLQNEEFVLRILFTVLPEAPMATWNFCGPMYVSENIRKNFSISLSKLMDVKKQTGLKLIQWLQVLQELVVFEQSVGVHEHEGRFLVCNLTADHILLSNECFIRRPRNPGTCSFKIAELVRIIIAEDSLKTIQALQPCQVDSQCQYASCSGRCTNGTCHVHPHAYLAGIHTLCRIFKTLSDRITLTMDSARRGEWYVLLDKCLQDQLPGDISTAWPTDEATASHSISSLSADLTIVIWYNMLSGSLLNFLTDELSIQTVNYMTQFGV